MTVVLPAKEVAAKLNIDLNANILDTTGNTILVKSGSLKDLITSLKTTPGFEFNYLNDITAVDYWDYFELVYLLTSIKNNQQITVKTRITGRENTTALSISGIFKGAENQEREIHDLMGITFEGHPNMSPIVLWEGFKGYPLRKDYL